MLRFTNRYAEYCEIAKINYLIVNSNLWSEYQKTIVPVAPVKYNYSLNSSENELLFNKFSKALMLRYTDGFETEDNLKCKEWFAIINDSFTELEFLQADRRNEIKRGFKNCTVELVDAEFIASNGFDVFISAYKRYKSVKAPDISENEFKQKVVLKKTFDDIFHFWGVFFNSKLIGFAENFIFDDIEAGYSTIKLNPDYLSYYPSYALIYSMNKYYLQDHKVEYVNDGFRSILHQSNIQEFLINKFDFQKKYTNLNVNYRFVLSSFLSLTSSIGVIKKNLAKLSPKLSAIYKLDEISKHCSEFKNKLY